MAKKLKVPKRIAGVKVPRHLRWAIRDLAKTQNGETVLTEALVAAAGLLAAHEAQPGSRTRQMVNRQAPRAKAKAKAMVGRAAGWAASAGAFQEATRAFTDSLNRRSAEAAGREVETPPISQH